MWHLLTSSPCRRAGPCGVRHRRAQPEAEIRDGDETLLGCCGWFDSSHELERGLQVSEADATALSALPVADWIDLELSGWRPAAAAS